MARACAGRLFLTPLGTVVASAFPGYVVEDKLPHEVLVMPARTLPRHDARCRAILMTKADARPFRRCDTVGVLESGYCRAHAYPPSTVARFEAMWVLLGPDWVHRQDELFRDAAVETASEPTPRPRPALLERGALFDREPLFEQAELLRRRPGGLGSGGGSR